jgi:hypothetical protein
MALFFLLTIVSAVAEAHVHPGRSGAHTVFAILFIVLTLAHVIINRKAFRKNITGTSKKAKLTPDIG